MGNYCETLVAAKDDIVSDGFTVGTITPDQVKYLSYEGTRLVQGNTVVAQVPTAAMKSANRCPFRRKARLRIPG